MAIPIVKGLGGFDRGTAWAAKSQDIDVGSDEPLNQGRMLSDYLPLGYIPSPDAVDLSDA